MGLLGLSGPSCPPSLSYPQGPPGPPSVWDDADSDAAQDSWQESEHPEHTHDPHEVTVQLDGVGRQLEDWLVQQAKGAPSTKEASDGPVFVDETGRRSRRYRRIGMAVGMACAVYAVVILATLMSGNSSAPWLPELGQEQDDKPAGKVEIPPLPADSADPSGAVVPSPGVTPSAGGTVSNAPGAGTLEGPVGQPHGHGEEHRPEAVGDQHEAHHAEADEHRAVEHTSGHARPRAERHREQRPLGSAGRHRHGRR